MITYTSSVDNCAEPLRAMARRSFEDTFGHLYDAESLRDFLDSAYGQQGSMERAFADPAVRWRVAISSEGPVGYARLNPLRAPAPEPLPGALQMQQLFVLREWQGRGVAQNLMDWALTTAAEDAPELYLTVFDHNERAKRFYAKNGFSDVGRTTFRLGDRVDDDRIWRRALI